MRNTLKRRMLVILWRFLDACIFFVSEASVGGGERMDGWLERGDRVLLERFILSSEGSG